MGKTLREATHLALAGLALGGLTLTGCGQTDFFSVSVTIDPKITPGNLQQVAQCEVMPSGAVSDSATFILNYCVCGPDTNYTGLEKDSQGNNVLGTFEYGTTKTSGTVHFQLSLKDGSRNAIGGGHADGNIGSGVVPVTLLIDDTSGL